MPDHIGNRSFSLVLLPPASNPVVYPRKYQSTANSEARVTNYNCRIKRADRADMPVTGHMNALASSLSRCPFTNRAPSGARPAIVPMAPGPALSSSGPSVA